MNRIKIGLIILFAFLFFSSNAQELKRQIKWYPIQSHKITDTYTTYQLYFDGAQYNVDSPGIPYYEERLPGGMVNANVVARIINETYELLDEPGIQNLKGLDNIGEKIDINADILVDRKIPYVVVSFIPVRKNPRSGRYEKLVKFEISYDIRPGLRPVGQARSYRQNSVLASGNWYKISVTKSGIHKLSYNDLSNMGIPVSNIDPRNIRIYGNGGGMLPERNSAARYDDLMENSIFVSGENDGKFDQSDYVLFYGESPHEWTYNPLDKVFNHENNIYSDYTYYFITTDLGPGKRTVNQASSAQNPTNQVNTFTDRLFIDNDKVNIVRTGRDWFDFPPFDLTLSYDYPFSFPNRDNSAEVYMKTSVVARSFAASNFKYYANNQLFLTVPVTQISSGQYSAFANKKTSEVNFTTSGDNISIRVDYIKTSSGASGWMDYIELNARRLLRFTGSQLAFRDPLSVGTGNIAEYTLSNATASIQVWNITNPLDPARISANLNGNNLTFRLPADSLLEFIAFNGESFYSPSFVEKVENQNLHAIGSYDMIIISHSSFLGEATRLANHHISKDNFDVFVVDQKKVYNEFSSGSPDITGIGDFMKMLYDRASPGNEPRYLLLFGDASYDYKNRIEGNNNMVPAWVDPKSLNIINSVTTDDYYGFLDDNEGGGGTEAIDIGIGRLPVTTIEDARIAVNKIIHYSTNSQEVMGSWRNIVCFVGDDEDNNTHLNHAEQMGKWIDTTYKQYVVDKIYLDAYPQESTPGGQRAPQVNTAINQRVEKGALIMNYTGHGGEVGWGHERILQIADINSWKNDNKLPIFVTATCEFSRFDDPERVSAGEMVFLNPDGGTIAMFTTARATYGSSNLTLNRAFYEVTFEKINGEYPRFGDLIRNAKNKQGSVNENDKKFVLLGDPALKLAYPEFKVVTKSINGSPANSPADTIKALQKITVTGEIHDENGNKLESFNGTIFPAVYDKPAKIRTLATDPSSFPYTFELWSNILYKGKASINNGSFSFTFIVPKDIAYQYGFGKINYYADNSSTDANGYYDNIVVGGFQEGAMTDEDGPDIELYMNDESFVFGGMTDENPKMIAYVSDESGVNTVGNGIGHDIVAILDKTTDKSIILNDYYEADLDSYTSGSIKYPFSALENGDHSLSLKVWDVYNNSSEAYIEFVVAESAELAIEHVLNYPNPFTTHTEFFFEHNQPNSTLEVLLQVFTISGRLVYSYNDIIPTSGFRTGPLPPYGWDGRDDFGDRLARGVYLYKVRVKSPDGSYAHKLEKLVILK